MEEDSFFQMTIAEDSQWGKSLFYQQNSEVAPSGKSPASLRDWAHWDFLCFFFDTVDAAIASDECGLSKYFV